MLLDVSFRFACSSCVHVHVHVHVSFHVHIRGFHVFLVYVALFLCNNFSFPFDFLIGGERRKG